MNSMELVGPCWDPGLGPGVVLGSASHRSVTTRTSRRLTSMAISMATPRLRVTDVAANVRCMRWVSY